MNSYVVVDHYFGRLGNLLGGFDFARPGQEGSLGKDVAGIIAQGIIDRSVNNQGGATSSWPPNDPDYTEEKSRKYGVELIGFRTGQMISLPSLLGNVAIDHETLAITYGTGRTPTQSMSSPYISASDMKVTDAEKAGYFTDKKGAFFEPDDAIEQKVHDHIEQELGRFIEELNDL